MLILLSGGVDSTACLNFYLLQHSSVSTLFLEYGQSSAKQEAEAASRICQYYGTSLKIISCKGAFEKPGGFLQGRNAFLLFSALMEFKATSGIIAIGAHSGTSYFDCSKSFIQTMQAMFDNYTDGRIRVGAPFLEWTKQDIWNYCINRQVPLQLTYSCELGHDLPCGQCLSCRDRDALDALSKFNN